MTKKEGANVLPVMLKKVHLPEIKAGPNPLPAFVYLVR